MKKIAIAVAISAAISGSAFAESKDKDQKTVIPKLDHAFVIVMENHAYGQIIDNPNAPFINEYANTANLAANYYGVGHPSLTNYLEIVGGSNFGVINDNSPDWHNTTCTSNLVMNQAALEGAPNICPIAGAGLDGATPAVDTTNEGTPTAPVYNDPLAPAHTVAKTIADQLVEAKKSWKSYQENLPAFGADNVNWSDGLLTDATASPVYGVPHLYAVKHNPFAYFANVQKGTNPENSLNNIQGFEALYADLKSGDLPHYSLIAPNQCHDQHGRGTKEVGPGCSDDAGTIAQGDATVKELVTAIKASPAWSEGNNVIVVVWDENDYGSEPNQVVTIVDTNYGSKGVKSTEKYNHFSLLKTIEAGFGLNYLNHAADQNVKLMTDLFK